MSGANVGAPPAQLDVAPPNKGVSLVIMGVSGSGKTTLGSAVARAWGGTFIDADDHHPTANIEKMRKGQPLSDEDRGPWLDTLRAILEQAPAGVVLACSALRSSYRSKLGIDGRAVRLVYLSAPREVLSARLSGRRGHFAGPDLLESQLSSLEEPPEALRLESTAPVEENVRAILAWLARTS